MNQISTKTEDLENRIAKFAERLIDLLRKIPITPLNKRIIEQLVGSSGSIGANYAEATEAESRLDFIHKICIAKKETKETRHWLRLLAHTNPEYTKELRTFWTEAVELLRIFSKSVVTARDNVKIEKMKIQ